MPDCKFRIGMYLGELRLPLEAAMAKAAEIGAETVWYDRLPGDSPMAEMTDREADRLSDLRAEHNLEIFAVGAGGSFKTIHLCDLDPERLDDHDDFVRQSKDLTRAMQIARRLGVSTVSTFTFAWPGEYVGGKPTWPMRWLTRGGVITDGDMDKLVAIFSRLLEEAERYDVDLAMGMMPWNFTNTTGNFRLLAERLGSRRVKVMWGPSDNWNSGEWDVATAGFHNVRPYLHALHLKDLRVIDGLRNRFEYCPIGEGDVDYRTIFRTLGDHRSEAVLSLSTHFLPPGGSAEEAMRINYANLRRLIDEIG